ncbi:MAG: hypothetical protein JNM93_06665 [Bacteriovoracaceae bacterium]|nr:hypothetical protein [Bacteriovoracaceae bacterium]
MKNIKQYWKWGCVVLLCASLSTTIIINLSPYLRLENSKHLSSALRPIRTFAYSVGMDNAWQMFSYIYRHRWYSKFYAVDELGQERLLPLALQSKRTFWQKNFFDFKQAKFLLNIHNDMDRQEDYLNYLCMTFPQINKIRYYFEIQHFPNRELFLSKIPTSKFLYERDMLKEKKCQ